MRAPSDLPNMRPAGALTDGDRFWWSGRLVRVVEIKRRWSAPRPGVTVRVEPANGETWPPRALAFFTEERVELAGATERKARPC